MPLRKEGRPGAARKDPGRAHNYRLEVQPEYLFRHEGLRPGRLPYPPEKEKVLFLGEHPQAPGPSTSSGQAGWLRPLHPRVRPPNTEKLPAGKP